MLNELMPYLWIGVVLISAAVELLTLKSVAVLLIPIGIITFSLSLTNIFPWVQVCIFIIISFILLLLRVLPGTNLKKFSDTAYLRQRNLHNPKGRTAIVVKEIDNHKNTGKVRINGTIWDARTDDSDIIYESGIIVTVAEVDESNGMILICSKEK